MANQLHPDKRRITYAEWKDVYATLEKMAEEQGKSVTDIVREAVEHKAETYLRKRGGKAKAHTG